MGAVQHYYILRKSSMKPKFQKFSGTRVFDLINESDEEELPGDQSTRKQDYHGKLFYRIPEKIILGRVDHAIILSLVMKNQM